MTVISEAQNLWLSGRTIEGLCADGIVVGFEHQSNREAVVLYVAGVINPDDVKFHKIPVWRYLKSHNASRLCQDEIESFDFFCETNRFYVPKNIKEEIRKSVPDGGNVELKLPKDVVDSLATLILTGELNKRGRFAE